MIKTLLLAGTSVLALSTTAAQAVTFSYIDAVQSWTAPMTGVYAFEIAGAQGGDGLYAEGGLGAIVVGDLAVTGGQTFEILAGSQGGAGTSGGGGGLSGVFAGAAALPVAGGFRANTDFAVGGGGGGGGFNPPDLLPGGAGQAGPNGGAGYTTLYGGVGGTHGDGGAGGAYFNGYDGGGGTGVYTRGGYGPGFVRVYYSDGSGSGYYRVFRSGGDGGDGAIGGAGGRSYFGGTGGNGGFGGGGGGGYVGGGGGGGFSGGGGGGAGGFPGGGGGGGSFALGFTDVIYSAGANAGNGFVEITPLDTPVPEPSTWAMMLSGFGFLGYVLRRRVLRA